MYLDNLDKYQKLKLIDGLQSMNMVKDEFIFQEGDTGEEFYIIEEGEVECLKKSNSSDEFLLIRTLKRAEHFGELALINNKNRSLSIRISSPECKLLKLDRDTFTRILGSIEKQLKMDYGESPKSKIEQTFETEAKKIS
jgi:cAMP-dependent protein kinase regulator